MRVHASLYRYVGTTSFAPLKIIERNEHHYEGTDFADCVVPCTFGKTQTENLSLLPAAVGNPTKDCSTISM